MFRGLIDIYSYDIIGVYRYLNIMIERTINPQLITYDQAPTECRAIPPIGAELAGERIYRSLYTLANDPRPLSGLIGVSRENGNGSEPSAPELMITSFEFSLIQRMTLFNLQRRLLQVSPQSRTRDEVTYWDETELSSWAGDLAIFGEDQVSWTRNINISAIRAANRTWAIETEYGDPNVPVVHELKLTQGQIVVADKPLRPTSKALSHMVLCVEPLETDQILAQYPHLEKAIGTKQICKVIPANFHQGVVDSVHALIVSSIDFVTLRRRVLETMLGGFVSDEISDAEVDTRLLFLGFDLSRRSLSMALAAVDSVELLRDPAMIFVNRVRLMENWGAQKAEIRANPVRSTQYKIWALLTRHIYTQIRIHEDEVMDDIDPREIALPLQVDPNPAAVHDLGPNIAERNARRLQEAGDFTVAQKQATILEDHPDDTQLAEWHSLTREEKAQRVLDLMRRTGTNSTLSID